MSESKRESKEGGAELPDEWIQQYKIRKLIKNLEGIKGHGTSMITLIMQPGEMVAAINARLVVEYATAGNIKSRVNRQSVQSAISAVQEKLKLYSKIPSNGLVIYSGEVQLDNGTAGGKSKLMVFHFEPYKPINTKMYMCDKRFHTEPLAELLTDDKCYGYIILDGESVLMGTLSGTTKRILHKRKTSAPGKTRRGGQSANRIERLRKEKVNLWIDMAAEQANRTFIQEDKVIVAGLIVAGKANTKNVFVEHQTLDPRLKAAVKGVYDVSYGLENGFHQAVRMSADCIENSELNAEKEILTAYYDELAKGGKFCVSVKDTMMALEQGAVKELIIWDELKIMRNRYTSQGSATCLARTEFTYTDVGAERPEKIRRPAGSTNAKDSKDHKEGKDDKSEGKESKEIKGEIKGTERATERSDVEYTLVDSTLLSEWLMENKFGANLHIVCNRSPEGVQFTTGLGGIGGILHYPVDFVAADEPDDEDTADNKKFMDDDDFI